MAGEEAVARAIGLPRNVGPGLVTFETGRGRFRVPDFNPFSQQGTQGTLAVRGSVVEVKNVATLRLTPQLRDLLRFAESQDAPLEIFTNAKTISKEILRLQTQGRIRLSPIPE